MPNFDRPARERNPFKKKYFTDPHDPPSVFLTQMDSTITLKKAFSLKYRWRQCCQHNDYSRLKRRIAEFRKIDVPEEILK